MALRNKRYAKVFVILLSGISFQFDLVEEQYQKINSCFKIAKALI